MPYAAIQHPGPYTAIPWAQPTTHDWHHWGWVNFRVWTEDFQSYVDIAARDMLPIVISMGPAWCTVEPQYPADKLAMIVLRLWMLRRWGDFNLLPKDQAEAFRQGRMHRTFAHLVDGHMATLQSLTFEVLPPRDKYWCTHDITLVGIREACYNPFTFITLKVSYGDTPEEMPNTSATFTVTLTIRTPARDA